MSGDFSYFRIAVYLHKALDNTAHIIAFKFYLKRLKLLQHIWLIIWKYHRTDNRHTSSILAATALTPIILMHQNRDLTILVEKTL